MTRNVTEIERAITLALLLLCSGAAPAWLAAAETPIKRARPPKFDHRQVTDVFFEDLFQVLTAPPPTSSAPTRPDEPSESEKPAESAAAVTDRDWSSLVSATTLEDEVKRIKLSIDKNVGTPADFAAGGYRSVRRDFTLLALIFGIIREYGGTVRWQGDSHSAHVRFATAASHAQASGNAAVYQEVRQRQSELQDLVGGGSLAAASTESEDGWVSLDRALLMQRLEAGSQTLAAGLAGPDAFTKGKDELLHEGELTAAISKVLTAESMDDAAEAEYASFAREMQRAASSLVQSVRQDDYTQARQASGQLSKACTDCHAAYR